MNSYRSNLKEKCWFILTILLTIISLICVLCLVFFQYFLIHSVQTTNDYFIKEYNSIRYQKQLWVSEFICNNNNQEIIELSCNILLKGDIKEEYISTISASKYITVDSTLLSISKKIIEEQNVIHYNNKILWISKYLCQEEDLKENITIYCPSTIKNYKKIDSFNAFNIFIKASKQSYNDALIFSIYSLDVSKEFWIQSLLHLYTSFNFYFIACISICSSIISYIIFLIPKQSYKYLKQLVLERRRKAKEKDDEIRGMQYYDILNQDLINTNLNNNNNTIINTEGNSPGNINPFNPLSIPTRNTFGESPFTMGLNHRNNSNANKL